MPTFRIGSFNVENLFDRPKAMNGDDPKLDAALLDAHARLGRRLEDPHYTDADKQTILDLLDTLGLTGSDDAPYAVLRQVRGRLITRPRTGPPRIVADGRGDWIGWVDLKKERVDEIAMTNTARVITDVHPEILAVVEAESRTALKHFTDSGLLTADGKPLYPQVMVIDGNDDRGIDVGIMTKAGYLIESVRSHVDDTDDDGPVFGRDCPEYTIALPGSRRLVILVNHLKSKGYGRATDNDERRRRQAARTAQIYTRLRNEGTDLIAVVGDLNDTPDSAPLAPLISGTDLRDITTHPSFTSDGRPGTYANGTKSQKIDYLLLSPALFAAATAGGIFRKGVWGGTNGTLFPHYDTMTSPAHAASDHAAIWAELTVD